jgi:hypothetical protein
MAMTVRNRVSIRVALHTVLSLPREAMLNGIWHHPSQRQHVMSEGVVTRTINAGKTGRFCRTRQKDESL